MCLCVCLCVCPRQLSWNTSGPRLNLKISGGSASGSIQRTLMDLRSLVNSRVASFWMREDQYLPETLTALPGT